ncbi:hypothetical protein GmHk_U059426 [Glycine max]|nr:hypothetical protein GmHk_U059426 [Glycine max]
MHNSIITYIGLHCSAHWQMVVILPKENVVIWFCSLHNRSDNYLKGIINSVLKGFDDTPQSKSKVVASNLKYSENFHHSSCTITKLMTSFFLLICISYLFYTLRFITHSYDCPQKKPYPLPTTTHFF